MALSIPQIRLFLTDVDGCLTDGGMYYSANGDELKKFCVYDGMGMVMLRQSGIRCGIITSETTNIVLNRARKLNLDYLYMGVGRKSDKTSVLFCAPATAEPIMLPACTKLQAANELCRQMDISLQEVAFVGDDINDLELLQHVGFAACPTNAIDKVKNLPDIYHLTKQGGDGAIRELTDIILYNQQ